MNRKDARIYMFSPVFTSTVLDNVSMYYFTVHIIVPPLMKTDIVQCNASSSETKASSCLILGTMGDLRTSHVLFNNFTELSL